MAGSTRQGHKGIQFSGGLSQPTQNIKNSRHPFVSHSTIRLSTVQTPITTTPPPAPHAIPSSGGQQIEDGRLVLDGGVQGFGAPSCKESGTEACIGGSIEAPRDGGCGSCEGSSGGDGGGGGGSGGVGALPRCSAGIQESGR